MATLQNAQIDQSFGALLKTDDNGNITATPKAITDGAGNATNMEMSNTETKFSSGTVDFTGSTVSGLPGGAAGLESGTGSDSMQSAASLTTNAANAAGDGSVALGDGASAQLESIAIGDNAVAQSGQAVVIGHDADANVGGQQGVAVGTNASSQAAGAVALGRNVTAATTDTVSVKALETQTDGGVNIKGDGTNAGKLKLYCEDAGGAHNVTLEGPAHAGGATYSLKFPNTQSAGTQILEADASGNLAWINTPSGGGGSAGLESGTGTDSMQSAASLTTNAADAAGDETIALGDGASATRNKSVAIGDGAAANGSGGDGSLAIGNGAVASSNRSVAIGVNGTTCAAEGIAIGDDVDITSGNDRAIAIGNSINITTNADDAVVIGTSAGASNQSAIAIGRNTSASGDKAIAIGRDVTASGGQSMAYGDNAQATQTSAAAFGQYAEATATYAIAFGRTSAASGDGAVAFGQQTSAAQAGAVAMGRQVTADTADTTHVRALKIVAPDGAALGGNGITMLSPDGTSSEVTVTNNQELAINGTAISPVVSFQGTPWTLSTVASSDLVYETFMIPGGTFTTGDVIELSTIEFRDNLNNWGYSSLWFSDTAQTVGQAPAGGANNFSIAQKQSPSARENIYYNKKMYIKSNGTMVMPIAGTNDVDAEQSGDPVETYNINWANDQYFFYQLWNDSTTGSYTTSGTFLKKLN